MPRVPFAVIFRRNADGNIEPIQPVRIGGVSIGPGVVLRPGQIIAGLDFSQYANNDFEIDIKDDVMIIKGIYGTGQ